MITFEKIDLIPIYDLNFNTNIEKMSELAPLNNDIDPANWGEILRRHHSATGAGAGTRKVYGVEVDFDITTECEQKAVYDAVYEFFVRIFEERNVLSVKAARLNGSGDNKTSFAFKALIYPQVKRALNPDAWFEISLERKYTLNQDVVAKLQTHFEQTFSDKVAFAESTGYKITSNGQSIAQIDLISSLEFPAPDEYDYIEKKYDAYKNEPDVNHDMSEQRFVQTVQHAVQYFTTGVEKGLYLQYQTKNITQEKFLEEVGKFVHKQVSDISEKDYASMMKKIQEAVFGNYILEPLINADDISDIKVIDPKHIRVKSNGQRMTSNVSFIDYADYDRFIKSMAMRYGLDLDSKAVHVFSDDFSNPKYRMRINITMPLINSGGHLYLHIRKIRNEKMSPEELIKLQCMPRKVFEYLRYKANTSSLVFCGKGGSGKTTMMNTLLDEISFRRSGLVIQESEELFSNKQPDFMFEHLVPAERDPRGLGYTLQDEARNGLLTDLDYFIIGEIKGGEALYFLNAAATGHKCWCSVHAPDTKSAIDKLADYVMYESPYNKEQAMYMLKELKTIVYMENFKVKEISEITGYDEEKKCLQFKIVYKL